MAADPELLRAWLTARSVARGLAPPVEEFGGLRIDTNSEKEVRRWVFAQAVRGIGKLARSIDEPRNFIKLCGTEAELRGELDESWMVHGGSWFMGFSGEPAVLGPLPAGYALRTSRKDAVTRVEVRTNGGELAASGYAAGTPDAFVYDRIETDEGHRRRGLGGAVMAALGTCRKIEGRSRTANGDRRGREALLDPRLEQALALLDRFPQRTPLVRRMKSATLS